MTGRWLDPSKLAMLITYRVTACRTRWMSREGSLARRSNNPRSVITRRRNLSRFLNSSLSWRNWQTRTVESRVAEGSNPSDSTYARVVQLAGVGRFKICAVWVRIPPRVNPLQIFDCRLPIGPKYKERYKAPSSNRQSTIINQQYKSRV